MEQNATGATAATDENSKLQQLLSTLQAYGAQSGDAASQLA